MAIGTISNGEAGSSVRTKLNLVIAKINKYYDTATDNRLVRTDGTTGGTQESVVTLDDAGVMGGVTQLDVDNIRIDGNTISSTDVNGNINLTPNGTGTVVGVTKAMVGLGNVDNTSDATKNSATATLENKTIVTPIIAEISGSTKGQRPIVSETTDFNVGTIHKNTFCVLDITGAVVITIKDSSYTELGIGGELDLFWASDTGANTVTVTAIQAQSIISKDGNLKLSAVGSGASLKCIAANTWALVGDLTA